MKLKKVFLIVLLAIIIIGIIGGLFVYRKNKKDTNKIKVVASNFASYDFLRAILGGSETDDVELTFLLGPGKNAHSYDPTAQDIIKIQNADMFVYIGGEMESWSKKVLESIDTSKKKVICIADDVEKLDEEDVDGAEPEEEEEEEEGAFDEHIWTSPLNAISMVNALEKGMEEINPSKKDTYKVNAGAYINEIQKVDREIKEILKEKKRNHLVFGDKMPMQYFIKNYGLEVSAAFGGCSTETEPSSKTIAYLVDTVKKDNIPVVLYIEMNDGKVARTIANEVGNNCKAMQIQTLHNVSLDDFKNGETWVSLMKKNEDVLRAALD